MHPEGSLNSLLSHAPGLSGAKPVSCSPSGEADVTDGRFFYSPSSSAITVGMVDRNFAILLAQIVTDPPPMQETQVGFLGREDPPGEGHGKPLRYSSCRIPWTEEPGGLQSMGLRNRHDSDLNNRGPSLPRD